MRDINGKRVAVVGGAGFLGSHLVDYLIEQRNCQVTVIDNLAVGRREWVHRKARFVHHDITTSEEYLYQLFLDQGTEFVFNYAAWPYIPDSFVRPLQVFNVNATGAIKVVNAAAAAGVQGILQVSSAELYGGFEPESLSAQGNKIDECCLVEPHSTYGASKAAADYYCQAAVRERQVPVIILRQFNCYGPRETHPYVIPEIITQLHHHPGQVHLGNNTYRDFLYAEDAVAMATELLERGEFGEVYNMGSEQGIKIYDLAHMIGNVLGQRVDIVPDEARRRPWEIWHLCADNTKLFNTIQARPKCDLPTGLKRTVEYYITHGGWGW